MIAVRAGESVQVKQIGFFKGAVLSLCQVGMELSACHMYKRMVKIGDMLKVDNEAAVCLKKAVFRQ